MHILQWGRRMITFFHCGNFTKKAVTKWYKITKSIKKTAAIKVVFNTLCTIIINCYYDDINKYLVLKQITINLTDQLTFLGEYANTTSKIIIITILVSFFVYGIPFCAKFFNYKNLVKMSGIYIACINKSKFSILRHKAFIACENENIEKISIVCSTGLTTFSDEKSLFYNTIQSAKTVKILMCDPMSEGSLERMRYLGFEKKEWIAEIKKSIYTLTNIHNQGHNIKLRFYTTFPSTKLIILDNIAYVQKYRPDELSNFTPRFGFQKNTNSMYEIFADQFDRRWKYKKRLQYDFSNGKAYNERRTEERNIQAEIENALNEAE